MGLKSKPAKDVESEVRLIGGDVTSEVSKGAMIDVKSMADYRKEFESQRLQNRHATVTEILLRVKEYIKKRIDGIVDDVCKKRIMELTTVTLSVVSSTVIPFSGVAVVVAATVMQCLNFAVTLGLIPLLNVRSFSDLKSMSSQIGNTIKRASKSSVMAGVETAVLEILKTLGLGEWLWTEILKDILVEMIGDSAMNAAWIMTPLLAAPKYMLHRHLIKKMYRKLGDKAHVVHHTWTEQNCVQIEAQTTVVAQVQLDEYGNAQGTYLQAQEVSATQSGAQVSQTNVYFQQQDGGAGLAQVLQTNAYFQPQNRGSGLAQVSQTSAYFHPEKGDAGEVQVSQTNAYFQPQSGGAGEVQVSQTNAYFQPQKGDAGQVQVSQMDAHFQQQTGGAGEAQVSYTNAVFQPQSGGAGEVEVSKSNAYIKQQSRGTREAQVSYTNAFYQPQSGGAGEAEVSQTNAYSNKPPSAGAGEAQVSYTNAFFQPQSEGVAKAQVLQPNAFFQPQSEGVSPAQVSQPSAYFQEQAPPQKPWLAHETLIQSPYTKPAPGMVPGYPQGPIVQPTSNSNPPVRKNSTLIMGYTPPKNSSFFQPQVQPQGIQVTGHNAPAKSSYFQPQVQVGGGFQAAAAAQTYTPPPNPTYFQQPYGSQQTRPMYSQPQGNPYVQMGDYNTPQAAPTSFTQGHPQGNPYVQMGDYNKPQAAPASSTPGQNQFFQYVQMGDYNKMQTPMAYPPAGNPHQASAPPPDLWYQRQAN